MTRHLPEAERRAQLLRAARREFVEKGFRSARIDDIARGAGLSKGAVYFYFDSKRALLLALVEEEHAATLAILDGSAAEGVSPMARLLSLGQRYLDYFADLSEAPRFFLLMSELAGRDPELRARVQAMHERFLRRVEAVIAEGVSSGDFRPVDPSAVAMLLKAVMDGLAGQAAIGVPPDAERLRGDGIGVILRGLTSSPPSGEQAP